MGNDSGLINYMSSNEEKHIKLNKKDDNPG
jgi:hypothetical protein